MATWQRIAKLEIELKKQQDLVATYRRLYHVQCRLARAYRRHADRWRGLAARLLELR